MQTVFHMRTLKMMYVDKRIRVLAGGLGRERLKGTRACT